MFQVCSWLLVIILFRSFYIILCFYFCWLSFQVVVILVLGMMCKFCVYLDIWGTMLWEFSSLLDAIIQSQHGRSEHHLLLLSGKWKIRYLLSSASNIGWEIGLGWIQFEKMTKFHGIGVTRQGVDQPFWHCRGEGVFPLVLVGWSWVRMVIKVFYCVRPPFPWYFIPGKTRCPWSMFCMLMVPDSRLLLCPLWNI